MAKREKSEIKRNQKTKLRENLKEIFYFQNRFDLASSKRQFRGDCDSIRIVAGTLSNNANLEVALDNFFCIFSKYIKIKLFINLVFYFNTK